jgi:hypothetical protein
MRWGAETRRNSWSEEQEGKRMMSRKRERTRRKEKKKKRRRRRRRQKKKKKKKMWEKEEIGVIEGWKWKGPNGRTVKVRILWAGVSFLYAEEDSPFDSA